MRVLCPLGRPFLSPTLLKNEPLKPVESRGDLVHRHIASRAGSRAVDVHEAATLARRRNRGPRRPLDRTLWHINIRTVGGVAGLLVRS